MGLLDDVKKVAEDVEDKARGLVGEHGDKIEASIDRLAALAKDKAPAKQAEKIESGAAKAKDAVKKFGKTEPPAPPPDPSES
jgi:hypothetical protein